MEVDRERALSAKLYDVMEKVGLSEKIRKLHRDRAITHELHLTILSQLDNKTISVYIFGSFSEGTTSVSMSSDVDIVICDHVPPVIDDINTAPVSSDLSFLMVRDDDTYPGYVKLQGVIDGIPHMDSEAPYNSAIDKKGRICFKHFSMNTHITRNYERSTHNFERHGPADTIPEHEGSRSKDMVVAFKCKTIPCFERDWLYRRLANLRLSRNVFDTISGLGCFVVGVGHCSSGEKDIEWRLSFSLQERMIMFGLNPTQHKCYILLKIIKKDVIQQQIEESISITSYHCKTSVFYAIENTKAELWRPDQLITCLRICLMILLKWVYNGYCPNYFVPSENMFDSPRYREIRDRLVRLLRELVFNCPSFILRLQRDNIGQLIMSPVIHIPFNQILKHLCYMESVRLFQNNSYRLLAWSYKNKDPRHACQELSHDIERLNNTRCITEHTEQQTQDALSYMIPTLHLQLAQRLASIAFIQEGQSHCRQLLRHSLHHFRKGQKFDLMTSKLLIISVLIRLERFDLTIRLLNDVEDVLKCDVDSYCTCASMSRKEEYPRLNSLFKYNNIYNRKFLQSYCVACIRFLPFDAEITPIPLRSEMFRSEDTQPGSGEDGIDEWFAWSVVDGKVYVCFLQYLVFLKLNRPENKRLAIAKLNVVLNCDCYLGYKETGYNLLGWIYIQEGRYQNEI